LNLLTGVLAFLIIFWSFGYTLPLIGAVPAQTQAATTDLQPGDRILRFEGNIIRTTLDYSVLDMFHAGDQPLSLLVRGSDGQNRTVVLEPAWRSVYRLGVSIRQVAGQGIVIESVEQTSNGGNPLLLAGDVLLAANGVSVADMAAFTAAVQAAAGETMTIAVRRDGQALDIAMKATLSNDLVPRGIVFTSSAAAWPAVGQAFQWTWSIVKATVRSIGMIFAGSLRPQDALSGPVGVVSMISDVVSEDQPLADKIYQLLWLFAFIAVSLGFMNLLPIPPLDGNHLVLIVVEAIRGRRLSARVQNAIGIVGIGLIVVLALAGLLFDILRLTAR
jgi:regulator of sigma E protease